MGSSFVAITTSLLFLPRLGKHELGRTVYIGLDGYPSLVITCL